MCKFVSKPKLGNKRRRLFPEPVDPLPVDVQEILSEFREQQQLDDWVQRNTMGWDSTHDLLTGPDGSIEPRTLNFDSIDSDASIEF